MAIGPPWLQHHFYSHTQKLHFPWSTCFQYKRPITVACKSRQLSASNPNISWIILINSEIRKCSLFIFKQEELDDQWLCCSCCVLTNTMHSFNRRTKWDNQFLRKKNFLLIPSMFHSQYPGGHRLSNYYFVTGCLSHLGHNAVPQLMNWSLQHVWTLFQLHPWGKVQMAQSPPYISPWLPGQTASIQSPAGPTRVSEFRRVCPPGFEPRKVSAW